MQRCAAVTVAAALAAGTVALAGETPGLAGYVAAAVLTAALFGTRRHSRAVWIVAVAGLLAAAPSGDPTFTLALLATAHAFCAGRWEGRLVGLAAALSLVGGVELGILIAHGAGVPGLVPMAGWGAGRALGQRELVAARLAERGRELEEEREAHAQLSVRYERARIASELHDVVAHAITVMVVQAGAGQRLVVRDPDLAGETFRTIADAAHQAEQDIGRLVTLLGDESAIAAAPDLALIDELVRRAAASGLDVTLSLQGEREGLPAAHGEAAYRVIQEGLTNAMRYAAGAPVRVRVRGNAEALVVDIENDPGAAESALGGAGTGNGLRGLRERVGACGGTLEAARTADGGWRVAARLPRQTAVVAD